MEVKPGYRQTEVGVVPQDWEVRKIGSVCRLINGRGFKPFEWKRTGIPIIRIQNLNGSEDYNYYEGVYNKKLEIHPGQLLFAWSGSRGTSFGPHIWKGPFGLLNYHTWKVITCDGEISQSFLFHTLRQLTTFIEGWAHGASALVHVQKWQMEGFQFAIPPTKAEQEVIAEALSDADVLTESLEQLVAKKRHLKQGAMQKLLTGKTRLPGFSGEWQVKPLGEIGEALIGLTYKPTDVRSDGTLVLRSSNIHGGILEFDDNVFVKTEIPDEIMVRPGDILICVRNGSRELIGKCAKIDERPDRMTFGAFMAVFRTTHHNFVYHQFQSEVIKKQIHEHLGATINQITNKSLNSFTIPLPPSEAERDAIAAILSDMDMEITALEAKLTKARQIKQGMMQELLTGKTRPI
jgi:type I restriction enzyme S subunit